MVTRNVDAHTYTNRQPINKQNNIPCLYLVMDGKFAWNSRMILLATPRLFSEFAVLAQ